SFPSSGLGMPILKLCLTFNRYEHKDKPVLFLDTPSGAWQQLVGLGEERTPTNPMTRYHFNNTNLDVLEMGLRTPTKTSNTV
ncbi:MAG: hypothetical protein LUP96_07435, partial [Methylococcaceae bacterium]|nr:hypothetical protein [Methylococcaceae bacterium]